MLEASDPRLIDLISNGKWEWEKALALAQKCSVDDLNIAYVPDNSILKEITRISRCYLFLKKASKKDKENMAELTKTIIERGGFKACKKETDLIYLIKNYFFAYALLIAKRCEDKEYLNKKMQMERLL